MSFLVDLGVRLVVGILGNAEARGALVKAGGELWKEIKAQDVMEESLPDESLNARLNSRLETYLAGGHFPDNASGVPKPPDENGAGSGRAAG